MATEHYTNLIESTVPLTVDSLSFTSRDEKERMDWFDVDYPDRNSKYNWQEQYDRGIAYT